MSEGPLEPRDEQRLEAQEEQLLETPDGVHGGDYAPSVAARMAVLQRAGGIVMPVVTTLFAFAMAMIVIAVTGHNPFKAFKGIFDGTGLNWFFQFGSHDISLPFSDTRVWFWWDTASQSSFDLQQTLLLTTGLILTGFAVSFAFKCGLFNIGGQGQYIVGAFVGVWIGSSWAGMASGLHIFLAVALAALAGAAWAAIAGFLKATVGVHEVISTIMLNWIAIWVTQALVGQGGQLQNSTDKSVPVSADIVQNAHLPVFWGDPVLQGLHIGFFIALGAPVVYWLLLSRTTLGYEVRATGFNPEAARYGGVNVKRSYVLAMAISGMFAGLAGAIDILGWQFRLGVLDIQVSSIGFIGIAVALLGRNSPIGVPLAALLFGALLQGTSTRNPAIQDVIKPELAGNLTLIIQGLVLLFIGADLFFLWIWRLRKKIRRAPAATPAPGPRGATP
jgi:general nucleoside transport system permease protein